MSELLFWLLVGHALAHYPLQGDFLSRSKSHVNPVCAANGQAFPWWIALASHSLIHAGAVALITGSVLLGIAEFVLHFAIDRSTSSGRTGGYIGDQALHVACKIVWAIFAVVAL